MKSFLKSLSSSSVDNTGRTDEEKKEFFRTVVEKLLDLPAELVGSRLVRPLLSRFVLLDEVAATTLVPHLLTPCPEKERTYAEGALNPVFPTEVFKKHVIPEIYKIFHVRDAHIRLVLLSCFRDYVHMFDKETLRKFILPQLLLGLRDTNDEVVSASLQGLSHLVPILGGEVVIGGQRGRLFAEGKPKFRQGIQSERLERSNAPTDKHRNGVGPVPVQVTKTLKELAKDADKEKRKEEIRKRNEERRRKREERKNNPVKAVLVNDFDESQKREQENVGDGEVDADEESREDEEETWSDWENPNNGEKQSDSYIEDHVEGGKFKSVNDSPSSESPVPVVMSEIPEMHWNRGSVTNTDTYRKESKSDTTRSGGKGALRLGKSKDSKKNDDLVSDWKDEKWTSLEDTNLGMKGDLYGNDWQSDWSDSISSTSSSTKQSKKKTQSAANQKQQKLGAEFGIEIKVKETVTEPDFFEDMKPVFKTEDSVLDTVLKAFQDQDKQTAPSTLSFTPVDSTSEVGVNWGDDLDWAEPDETEAAK